MYIKCPIDGYFGEDGVITVHLRLDPRDSGGLDFLRHCCMRAGLPWDTKDVSLEHDHLLSKIFELIECGVKAKEQANV